MYAGDKATRQALQQHPDRFVGQGHIRDNNLSADEIEYLQQLLKEKQE